METPQQLADRALAAWWDARAAATRQDAEALDAALSEIKTAVLAFRETTVSRDPPSAA